MVRWLIAIPFLLLGLSQVQAQTNNAPEKTIQLDLHWMSPPTLLPADGTGSAQQQDQYIRLAGRTASAGYSFTWPLRYPIPAPQYSVLVVRYRARGLIMGNDYADRILQLDLGKDGNDLPDVVAISLSEVVQDGASHEIRKELAGFVNDAEIDALRFTFQPQREGGFLDIFDIRFERGFVAPAADPLIQQPVDLAVTDQYGQPLADAEVHVGLLERANWAATGRTDRFGRVSLMALMPAVANGVSSPKAEAAVLKDGYLPQYVAPIEFPLAKAVEVKLAPPAQIQQEQPAEPVAPEAQPYAQVPGGVIYSGPNYPYGATYYDGPVTYVSPYAPGWWVPTYWVRPPHHHDHDGDRGRHDGGGQNRPGPDNPPWPGRHGEPQRPTNPPPRPAGDTLSSGPIRTGQPPRLPRPQWNSQPPNRVVDPPDADNRRIPLSPNRPDKPARPQQPPAVLPAQPANPGAPAPAGANEPRRPTSPTPDKESTIRSAPPVLRVDPAPTRREPPRAVESSKPAPQPPTVIEIRQPKSAAPTTPVRVEEPPRLERTDRPAPLRTESPRREAAREESARVEPVRTEPAHVEPQRPSAPAPRLERVNPDPPRFEARASEAPRVVAPAPAPAPTPAADDSARAAERAARRAERQAARQQ